MRKIQLYIMYSTISRSNHYIIFSQVCAYLLGMFDNLCCVPGLLSISYSFLLEVGLIWCVRL